MGNCSSIEKCANKNPEEFKKQIQNLYSKNNDIFKDICLTLNRPVKPESISKWQLINDTNQYILVHFVGKSNMLKINTELYSKLWNIQTNNGTNYISRYSEIMGFVNQTTVNTPKVTDVSTMIQTPINNTISSTPINNTIPSTQINNTIPSTQINNLTYFNTGNDVLDQQLFPQTGGSDDINNNLRKLFNLGAFIILEPQTGYIMNDIFNFFPFAFTKLTTINNITVKDVTCLGIIYPSTTITKISEFKSNDVMNVYKNEICLNITKNFS